MTPAVAGGVSIVIPCFNQQHYVVEAVESALQQSHRPLEIIVVDDGSEKSVCGVLSDYPVRVVRQENAGVSAARNRGLAESSGEYVIFLDADDRLLPGAAAAGISELTQHPSAACAVGLCRVMDSAGRPAPFRQRQPLRSTPYCELLRGNFIWMPGQVVFKRSALGAAPFDSSVDACADYDLYLRTARHAPLQVHDAMVAEYRQHSASMSENGRLMLRLSLLVLGRQWPFLHDEGSRAAWRAGRKFWREFYGDRVVDEVRAAIRSPGRRWTALAGMLALLRYHPIGALRQLVRKARVITNGPRPAAPAGLPGSSSPPLESESTE